MGSFFRVKLGGAAHRGRARRRPWRRLYAGDGRSLEPGAGKLAHDPRQLQGMELQSARSDQYWERKESRAGLERFDRRRLRPRGPADRQQWRDVRRHPVQSGDGAGRRERRSVVALQAQVAAGLQRAAQHQPRRGAVWRQSLFSGAGCDARGARREDRQGCLGS